MRISDVEFRIGKSGREYPAVLQAMPEEGGVDYFEIEKAYTGVSPKPAATLEKVLQDLEFAGVIERKSVGGREYYQRRKSWWSSKEVAAFLGVSQRTIQLWANEGKLPFVRVGAHLRFPREAVEDLGTGWETKRGPITAAEDPVLAELWDNEADAAYDNL
jgi:excisionase family DNA binding protein